MIGVENIVHSINGYSSNAQFMTISVHDNFV